MVVNMLEKKLSTDCRMFDVKGSLLVSICVHSILPPFLFHLVLSLVMPCTLVRPFVFFDNTFKSTNGMVSHKNFSPFEYGIVKCETKQIDDINVILFTIGLNGFTKHAYMNIWIHSHIVNGVG
jgi:hypothetical protein